MKIVYWSDYACPYCYIGETRLHKAIKELNLEKEVSLEPRAFQLDPTAPLEPVTDTLTRFAQKYRLPLEAARQQIKNIEMAGQAEGIDFKYASTKFTNTFNAHRLMKLALSHNSPELANRTNNLLFDAYFTKNLKLSSPETLLAVAELAGLKKDEVEAMLASEQFASAVRADKREAADRNIHGVPYFIFPGGFSIPGAISVKDFKDALEHGLRNARQEPSAVYHCGSDGCLI